MTATCLSNCVYGTLNLFIYLGNVSKELQEENSLKNLQQFIINKVNLKKCTIPGHSSLILFLYIPLSPLLLIYTTFGCFSIPFN